MALQAYLVLDSDTEKSYFVRELNYDLERRIGPNGKPSTAPKGGIIHFTILSQNEDNLVFHEWIMGPTPEKQVGTFYLWVTDGPKYFMRTLRFEGAFLFRLSETYSGYSAAQMHMNLSISAQTIKFSADNPQTDLKNDEIK